MPPSPPPYLTQQGAAVILHLKVVPNSSRTRIAGALGNALKLKIAQPPEDGKANKAVIAFLADTLEIPAANITLIAGHTNPQKTLQLTGITLEAAATKLAAS
jgi:uncharacterized protein (TIGR00251 family)